MADPLGLKRPPGAGIRLCAENTSACHSVQGVIMRKPLEIPVVVAVDHEDITGDAGSRIPVCRCSEAGGLSISIQISIALDAIAEIRAVARSESGERIRSIAASISDRCFIPRIVRCARSQIYCIPSIFRKKLFFE